MNGHWVRRAWERNRLSGKIAWALLLPFSWLFLVAVHIRNLLFSMNWRRSAALERPVISIGNLTVGGTGKTPSCIWLARELGKSGLRIAILSRGYRRKDAQPAIFSPGDNDSFSSANAGDVDSAGDEPFMMARLYGQTVAVGRERHRAAQELLRRCDVDAFILDDGFQHRQLKRDVDLVLLGCDSTGGLLPSGPFREPRSALRRADFFLLTGSEQSWRPFVGSISNGTCFAGTLEAVALVGFESNLWKEHPLSLLYGSRILAVAGIAKPARFYRFIRDHGGEVVDILEFSDHHRYSSQDWQHINRAARNVDLIVTTEKDMVKLVRFPFARNKLLALRVAMIVENG
ncbi:MAG TPA: tetraacyldisaccharide 4'-kinase, partial [Methylomirabilota bacterium]|nr:tetraacyldisaccharide 4'-kinase [Methylomirabilota bacterium]